MLKFKEYLIELFDKPWKLENINGSDFHSEIKKILNNDHPEHSKLNVFHAVDDKGNHQGHIIEYQNNGAVEIHHINKDLRSGEMVGGNKPNVGFIATMKDRIIHHANNKSTRVRVVGRKYMIGYYEKTGKKIISKYKDLKMSETKKHETPGFDDTHAFTIKPKNKFGLDHLEK